MDAGCEYSIRLIESNDNSKPFKSGSEEFAPLKTFLQKQAYDFHVANIARTYVAVRSGAKTGDPDIVIAFIALVCSEVDIRNGYSVEDCPYANRYESLPAIKIARLAVDQRYRGQGIGPTLVSMAIALAMDVVSPNVGCRFIVTDAKEGAINFYQREGFTLLDTEENRVAETPVMFIDLMKMDDVLNG